MKAGHICTRDVCVISRDETIQAAARRMRDCHVGCLVLTDDPDSDYPTPRGIITDRDIVVRVVAAGQPDIGSMRVGDIAHRPLVTATRDEAMETVLARMEDEGVRRIPIIDEAGRLVGILTMDDILAIISDRLLAMVDLIRRGPRFEQAMMSR